MNESIKLNRVAGPNKKILITIGIAVILLAALWIWKSVAVNEVKKDAEKNRQTLKEQATAQIVQSHIQHLKILAKAYVWAARGDMMQGNNKQLNLYANDMITEKSFQQISVANDKGIIISSTNKKNESQLFSTIANASYLNDDTTHVDNSGDSMLIVTSPIMGFNSRLGTLFIKYEIPTPVYKQ
ncbi:MAG: hypothetical protein ABIN89_27560 [Chitinophagaceae bacterium]